jgi:hypothetical protein
MIEHFKGYLHFFYSNERRKGNERRKFSYTLHLPERRSGMDRRSGLERRKTPRQKINKSEMKMRDNSIAFDDFS